MKTKHGKSSQIKKRLSRGTFDNGKKPNGNILIKKESTESSQGNTQEKHALEWLEPKTPDQIIEELIEKHNKTKFHVLLSGGKDSICIADYISKNYPENFEGVIFTNTGIASPMTRQWVLKYKDERKWKLDMTYPPNKTFYDIVIEHGFPKGRKSHRIVMGYLKFHSWYHFLKKKKDTHAYISGVRKDESMTRSKTAFYTKKPIDENATLTFCKPFLYKNGTQLWRYFNENELKKSPADYFFNKSGDCWCGAFTNEWERKMLEKYDRFIFDTIVWLETQVKLYGSETAKRFPYWGRYGNPMLETIMQTTLENFPNNYQINDDYCLEGCIREGIR